MARWSGVVWLWWATVAWLVARVTRAMGSSSWCRVRLVWLGVLLVTRMGSNAGRHRGTWAADVVVSAVVDRASATRRAIVEQLLIEWLLFAGLGGVIVFWWELGCGCWAPPLCCCSGPLSRPSRQG